MIVVEVFATSFSFRFAISSLLLLFLLFEEKKQDYIPFCSIDAVENNAKSKASFHPLITLGSLKWLMGRTIFFCSFAF